MDRSEAADMTPKLRMLQQAYSKGEFARAQVLMDELIAFDPTSPQGLCALYLRARANEDGRFGGKDTAKALMDYQVLIEHADLFGSDGMLGYARVLVDRDAKAKRKEAARLLMRAIEMDANTKAMMVLGKLYELGFDDPVAAGRWYLKAYRRGLPWGLRFYARMQARQGHRLRALACHAVASLTSPLFVLIHGVRSPFK